MLKFIIKIKAKQNTLSGFKLMSLDIDSHIQFYQIQACQYQKKSLSRKNLKAIVPVYSYKDT